MTISKVSDPIFYLKSLSNKIYGNHSNINEAKCKHKNTVELRKLSQF